MQFGKYHVDELTEGFMRLDGGSVFGVVPKTVWQNCLAPDSQNRVSLGLRQLLVRGPGVVLLADTGMGNKVSPARLAGLGVETLASWEERLAPFGVTREQVTHVVLTHLHMDHVGGATEATPDRTEVVPTFPNARHYVQEREWKSACVPDRGKTSYDLQNYLPLQQEGLLHCVSGDAEILEGIRVKLTGGHTRGHQMLIIGDANSQLFYPGDNAPTAFHLNPAWTGGNDLYPTEVVETRKWLVGQLLNSGNRVIFSHDAKGAFKSVTGTPEQFSIQEPGQPGLLATIDALPSI